MLRRALLAVTVLSYLICVLVLSGGQKDEINGKTTTKNLFNNEDLYKSCRNSSNVGNSNSLLNSSIFKKVIKKLHDLSNDSTRKIIDKHKNNQTEATELEKVIIARDKRTAVTNNNFDGHTTHFLEPNANKNIKYTDNTPDFHNVISFWQRFGKKNQISTTDNPRYKHQNKNNMLSNYLNSTNNEYFSKLIINKNLRDKDIIEGEYLGRIQPPFKPKPITSQTSTTTTSSVDFVTDDDTDIFKYILDSPVNDSVEKHDINAHVNQYSYEINYSKIVYKNNKSKHTEESSEKDKPDQINEYENFKTDNSQHSINFHEDRDVNKKSKPKHKQNYIHKIEKPININNNGYYKSDNYQHNIPVHDEMDIKYSVERTQYLYTTRKPEQRYKTYRDDHTTSTLPPEVIKKIAEDVKAMILKDLKRKTTTMLPVTIEKGLEALIPRYNAVQNLIPRYYAGQNLISSYNPEQNLIPRYNAEQNMAKPYPLTKILDILQKYRNGDNLSVYRKPSEAVPVYTTPKQPQNPNKNPYYLPVESKPLKLENNSPYINPYKIYKSVQSKKISPRFKYEVQKPKTFAPKRDLPPLKSYTSNNLKSTAITLQTNLIEIPPIGIPISEPVAFLNHHVIITTRRPFRNKQQNYPIKNDMKLKYNNPIIKHKPVRTRNVNPRINTNIKYDNYYNNNKKQPEPDKKRMSDVDESREIKTTKPRGVYRQRSQSNIKKFHEKLEQYPKMKYKEVNVDCCKDEIFTSEQILEDEMRSRDEVSFRNLLKTQQKVTDMLTQMLAKRKKEDLPLSVEAA